MLRKFLEWLSPHLPQFTIPQEDSSPYLTRHYLLGKDWEWFNIFLHKFHASDFDRDEDGTLLLHNHPFSFSFSFILCNSYIEFRRTKYNKEIKVKLVRPWSFNFINDEIFHRVELLDKQPVWTLFFTGKRNSAWYFLNTKTDKVFHHSIKGKSIA